MAAIDHVIRWLLEASSLVDEGYMRLPVAGADPTYRERVYCYELYHQLRCQWTQGFQYVLCGEIDKRKHACVCGDFLDNIKPDFLVHDPGQMDRESNLLAIEVKPANATVTKIVGDLKKLTALRSALRNSYDQSANYQHAIFWIYGGLPDGWEELKEELKRDNFEDVDIRLVRCFVHEHANSPAVEHVW